MRRRYIPPRLGIAERCRRHLRWRLHGRGHLALRSDSDQSPLWIRLHTGPQQRRQRPAHQRILGQEPQGGVTQSGTHGNVHRQNRRGNRLRRSGVEKRYQPHRDEISQHQVSQLLGRETRRRRVPEKQPRHDRHYQTLLRRQPLLHVHPEGVPRCAYGGSTALLDR